MAYYGEQELADQVRHLGPTGVCEILTALEGCGSLSQAHARELLRVAGETTDWRKLMMILIIGDLHFQNEFVDFAIDMLTFIPTGEDPAAVMLHAINLLAARDPLPPHQRARVNNLPPSSP